MNSSLFFENFELLADAPNGIQKLRELILQLAVMGKLVPQDPNDEPASILFERIKNERMKLLKAKKTTKFNLHSEIKPNEIPFALPKSWKWHRLEEIFYQISVSQNKVKLTEIQEVGDFPVIDQGQNYIAGYVDEAEKIINLPGPVVIFGDHTRIFKYVDFNFVAGADGVKILRPIGVYEKFFYLVLKSIKLNDRGYGRHFRILINNLFPLAPLEEQKRIVEKVEQLMVFCDKLEANYQKKNKIQYKLNDAALDKMLSAENQEEFEQHWQRICENFDLLYDNPETVDKLKQAILQLAVQGKLVEQNPEDEPASVLIEKIEADTKKVVNKLNEKKLVPINYGNEFFKLPCSWEWIQLGKLLTFGPKNGYSPKPVDFVTNTTSLTLSATTSGKFRSGCFKYIDEEIESDSYLWLEENDILIQRGNSLEYVGIAAVYKGSSRKFIYPDLMMKLRAHQDMNIDFLHLALNSKFARNYFAEKASGTSGSMPKINQNTVINLPIPFPPIEEQKRIVKKVQHLMGLCDELEKKLRKQKQDSEKIMEAVVKGLLEEVAC